jgi:hypothetical protein
MAHSPIRVPGGVGDAGDYGDFERSTSPRPHGAGPDAMLIEQQISTLQEQTDTLTKRIEVRVGSFVSHNRIHDVTGD